MGASYNVLAITYTGLLNRGLKEGLLSTSPQLDSGQNPRLKEC
jgi:hypothetical protein